MTTNQRRHGSTNKGNAARTVHTTMVPAGIRDDDEEYKRHVDKIEAVQESRGAYILGQGALDKNDSAFLLEQEEKRMLALKRKADSEKQMFAEMVAKSRAVDMRERDVGELETVEGKGQGRRRVKDMIVLSRVAKDGTEPLDTVDTNTNTRSCINSSSIEDDGDDDEGGDTGGLEGLLGDYGDSDDASEGEQPQPQKKKKETIGLPSALDVL